MSSVKNINNKITLLERKIKYGDNGGINVDAGTLSVDPLNNIIGAKNSQLVFTNTNNPATKESGIFISKDTPYPDALVAPTRNALGNMVLIGGSLDVSGTFQNYDDYSTIIHGSCKSGRGNSYFNCILGYGARMNAYDRPKSTILGCQAIGNESDCVAVGNRATSNRGGVSVGVNAGLDLSAGPLPNGSSTGAGNTFIGINAGRGIIAGQSNVALGSSSRFTGDVSNCLSINNVGTAANPGIGGIYGINLGLNTFQLGINNSVPRTTFDVSGNITTNQGTTTMTNGFTYIPAASGPPTGVPTSITGTAPMYADTLNNRFYVYVGGNWRYAALT
jgi:hypothetical protein